MTDDIITLRYSYVQSMVERISELEAENDQHVRTVARYMAAVSQMVQQLTDKDAEVERLRAAGDRLAEFAGDNPWAHLDIAAWQEARRG